MKNVIIGIISLLLLLIMIGSLSSCAKSDEYPDNAPEHSNNSKEIEIKKIAGTITMAGSTSMEKLANALSEAFMEKYPDMLVSAEFIGSGAGIEAVLSSTVNIGNSSRHLKETEISNGAVENIVAIDGIAVILDKSNSKNDISMDQLKKIFTGEINNWSKIGGENQPIVVIGREAGSGTRDAFEELLGIEEKCKYSNEINSTGGVMAKVASTPGAVGYVSLDVLDDTVSVAKIDGTEPTEEMIKAGSYLLSRPFIMATKGEISNQTLEIQAFFEFIKSEEGKELIRRIGLINVD
ncbi:phosphate ABC transporter substrate-binding protein [Lachnospiraceae bacterium MD1]|uniref:Phosphate-binding protein n=1 Tax=Variimorphobacter saccharofermentans TaxID=2755051 RepID=A0A839K4C6_9FIRM|nr:phosphate ABC transporter substrate-binding protein [Variimorphobacter saccharofermentans]MBB2184755.1 phosphate ABC transporter substrate-binding protein [Variimorphobacter saccharofermentans]